jgi:hypothetical protein
METLRKAVAKTEHNFQIDVAIDNVKRKEPSFKDDKTVLQKPEVNQNSGPYQWFNQSGRCVLCSLPLAAWAKCNDCWTAPVWIGVNGFWSWVHESCLDKEGTKRSLLLKEKGKEFLQAMREMYDMCEKAESTLYRAPKQYNSLIGPTSLFVSVIYTQAMRLAGWTQSPKRTRNLNDEVRKSVTQLFKLAVKTKIELESMVDETDKEEEEEVLDEEVLDEEEEEVLDEEVLDEEDEEEEEEEEDEEEEPEGGSVKDEEKEVNEKDQKPIVYNHFDDDEYDDYGLDRRSRSRSLSPKRYFKPQIDK